eukprot:TRINITY_DN2090_c0_g1_i1.p2 TRINITY_DN2090_c0_g1~~TRINITY_DN2090_c0_g1_i1.p2  ORF type:complete len:127 (+),score=47.34 TRINITY_DN2090_c0_g1_i1:792-1172(+)
MSDNDEIQDIYPSLEFKPSQFVSVADDFLKSVASVIEEQKKLEQSGDLDSINCEILTNEDNYINIDVYPGLFEILSNENNNFEDLNSLKLPNGTILSVPSQENDGNLLYNYSDESDSDDENSSVFS